MREAFNGKFDVKVNSKVAFYPAEYMQLCTENLKVIGSTICDIRILLSSNLNWYTFLVNQSYDYFHAFQNS